MAYGRHLPAGFAWRYVSKTNISSGPVIQVRLEERGSALVPRLLDLLPFSARFRAQHIFTTMSCRVLAQLAICLWSPFAMCSVIACFLLNSAYELIVMVVRLGEMPQNQHI